MSCPDRQRLAGDRDGGRTDATCSFQSWERAELWSREIIKMASQLKQLLECPVFHVVRTVHRVVGTNFLLCRGPARSKMLAFRGKSMPSTVGTVELDRLEKESRNNLAVWLFPACSLEVLSGISDGLAVYRNTRV